MRNLFAVDMTDPDNPTMPIEAFCRRRISEELAQKMDAHADEMTESADKAVRSWPHYIGMGAAAVGCFVFFSIFEAAAEEAETIPPTAWLWLIPAALCLGVVLLIGRSFRKLVEARMGTDEMTEQAQQGEAYYLLSRHELGVPDGVADVDILCYAYEMKKGKEKHLSIANEHYTAMELQMYVENDCLMLAEAATLYALPLSEVTAVTRLEGSTRIYCWNKDVSHKEEPYKPYRIRYDDDEDVFTVRAVYILEWGEEHELLVPDYEWDLVVAPLTGLEVTATEKLVSFAVQ